MGRIKTGDIEFAQSAIKKVYITTNADRIQAMSDEDLSEWLCRALDCDFCKSHIQNMSIYSRCENAVKGILNWLQQLTEEN